MSYKKTKARALRISQRLKTIGATIVKKSTGSVFLKSDLDKRGALYLQGLRAVGVLNYENDDVSGERWFLTRYLNQFPDDVILDVGANIGHYAELINSLGSRAVLHSFEPHPVPYEKLQAVSLRLGFVAHQMALGDKQSEIELFDYTDNSGSEHASLYREVIESIHKRPATGVKVRCEILDTVVEGLQIRSIGLLKIDTEGHELAVLKGASELLMAGRINVIQFEFNQMNVVSRVFMKDFFDILPNYRIYRLLPAGVIEFQVYDPTFMEVFAYQNIVCVRRDVDPFWLH